MGEGLRQLWKTLLTALTLRHPVSTSPFTCSRNNWILRKANTNRVCNRVRYSHHTLAVQPHLAALCALLISTYLGTKVQQYFLSFPLLLPPTTALFTHRCAAHISHLIRLTTTLRAVLHVVEDLFILIQHMKLRFDLC